jgi:hypothetical protein
MSLPAIHLIGLAALIGLTALPAAAHEHFPVGILDANHNGVADAGEALQFTGAHGAGVVYHLEPRAVGPQPRPEGYHPEWRCGGYYLLDERPRVVTTGGGEPVLKDQGFSMVALSSDPLFPEPGHAHPGAWIWCEIVSVTGPPGARLGFWDSQRSLYFDDPTFTLLTNQATGNPRFVISEGTDEADADTFGHVHDRSWTTDKPGDYFVAIRFIDLSTNRPGGGPWHQPSQTYVFHFKAGPDFTPSGQRVAGSGYVLTWPSQMGISDSAYPAETGMVFTILRSASLAGGDWTAIGSVTGTTAATATFTDPSPPVAKAFYRLAYDWSTP